MSQYSDYPERDDNEIGNDSVSEIGNSAKNLGESIKNYNEGQDRLHNFNSFNNRPDASGGFDNKDNPSNAEASGGADKPTDPNASDNPSNNTNNNGQNPDAPQQDNNQNGANGQTTNNQPSGTPQGNDSNVGNTPKVSSVSKPGDIAGESGGASTNAGMVGRANVNTASSGGQATYEGAQAASQGAEAAKQAGEVAQAAAEGAAEGSVVPGAGTVAVAAAKAVWASRHTIAKLLMVGLMVVLMLISALETLPKAIWQMAFDKNGTEVETSIEEVYKELEGAVQEVVTEAYNEAIEKAQKRVDTYGSRPDLNELYDISLGPELNTDICDVIAHFSVMCQVENKEPTKEYLQKLLRANKNKFFPIEELKMQKIEYIDYVLDYQKNETTKPMIAHISGDMMQSYMDKNGGLGPSAYDLLSAGGKFLDFDGDYLEPIFASMGEITTWYRFLSWWYGVADDVFYKKGETYILCSHDTEGNRTNVEGVYVDNVIPVSEYYIIVVSKDEDGNTVQEMKYIADEASVKGLYYLNRNEPTVLKTFEKDGINCIRVIVNQFNRNAMLDCFDINKNDPFPLVADFEGIDNSEEESWTVSKRYSPEEFTCGMAITAYEETLKNSLYGSGDIIVSAPGVNVYEYKVVNSLGQGVKGIEVSMFKDKECKQLVMKVTSDENGIATFKNFGNESYYIKETNKPSLSIYQLKKEVFSLDNTDKHCMTWGEFPVSSSGFISPLQVSDEGQSLKITSYFGYRVSPSAGASSNHGGLDIIIKDRKDNNITQGYPIRAAADGTVAFSGSGSGYGYYVHLIHDSGHQTLYAHNSQLCVKSGEKVKQGQIIAFGGGTPGTPGAGTSTGAHCHFEVRSPDGTRLNPLNYLPIE